MKKVLLLLLFTIVFCGDYRKPTRAQRKCFVKRLGEETTIKLFESLRKYHRTNGKATLLDYILDKRPDLKDVADECLLHMNRRRRLDKKKNTQNEDIINLAVKYYLDSLMKDNKTRNELLKNLKKNKNLALMSCKAFIENKEFCEPVINAMQQNLEN